MLKGLSPEWSRLWKVLMFSDDMKGFHFFPAPTFQSPTTHAKARLIGPTNLHVDKTYGVSICFSMHGSHCPSRPYHTSVTLCIHLDVSLKMGGMLESLCGV